MSDILRADGKTNDARKVLNNILEIYPDNNAITFQLLRNNIKDSFELKESVDRLNILMKSNKNNPISYKLLAEGYEKTEEK